MKKALPEIWAMLFCFWLLCCPPFTTIAWALGGLSLTMPTFRPPLAHPLPPLPGYWVGFL